MQIINFQLLFILRKLYFIESIQNIKYNVLLIMFKTSRNDFFSNIKY